MFAQQNSPPIQETAAPRRLWLAGPDGARPRLLFAEDSDPVRIITAAMLRAMGCDVEAVVHGEEALRSASDRAFDVIFRDSEMPGRDGITAALSSRKVGGTSATTPITRPEGARMKSSAIHLPSGEMADLKFLSVGRSGVSTRVSVGGR